MEEKLSDAEKRCRIKDLRRRRRRYRLRELVFTVREEEDVDEFHDEIEKEANMPWLKGILYGARVRRRWRKREYAEISREVRELKGS